MVLAAAAAAAIALFMSLAPRPISRPSAIRAVKASPVQPSPGGTTSRCPAKPTCGPGPRSRMATMFSVGPSGASPVTKRWTVKPISLSAPSSTSNTAPLAGVTEVTEMSLAARSMGSMMAMIRAASMAGAV